MCQTCPRRIIELEERQVHIKQAILKHMTQNPKLDNQILKVEPLAMKLTETQSSNILRSMGQSIFIHDVHHRIIFWNRAAEHVFGYTSAEVIGRSPSELIVEPESAHLSDNIIERTVKGESWYGVFPLKKKNGVSFLANCANRPYRDGNNRLIRAISISSDARPYQLIKVRLTVTKPTRTRSGFDHQLPPSQASFASKISNLALKVKSKMMIEENYTDNEDHLDNTFDSEGNTPRGHIDPSPSGVFFFP
ncbi:uncharacterized protein [Rutidosis leptorrhynchoides]|uniref:uncharacterized protein n=1 Tax=Rutidosis leptorrhynchoides TaxID=125765 RepID=UPI003A997644